MHWVDANEGILPLASYTASSAVHSDPEASVSEIFKRSSQNFEYRLRNRLNRALIESYVDAGTSFAPHAVEFGHQGYELGRFGFAGLNREVPLSELDQKGRETLAKLAQELHDLSLVSKLRMNTLDEFVIARVCDDSVDRLARAGRIQQANQRVFAIEGVPDFATLFRSGLIDAKEVPRLRVKRDAEKFRAWIRAVTVDPHGQDAGEAYLESLDGKRARFSSVKGRILKTITVSALSAGAGGVLAGPIGALAGAAAPTVTGMGFDLLDEFVLSGLVSGWRPRNYFENVLYPKVR